MKIKIYFLLVLLCLFLSGCNLSISQKREQSSDFADSSVSNLYTVVPEIISQGKITIKYPQIKGLGDDSKEKTINDIIKNTVWDNNVESIVIIYQDDQNVDVIKQLSQDLTYQVTLNTDALLSVVYTGTAYLEGGAFPTYVIDTITVDIKNAKKLELTDFTAIDNNLAQKIKHSTEVSNESVKEGMAQSNLIGEVQNFDDQVLIQGLKEKYAYYTYYLTPTSLVISVQVSHAGGDYALVTLPGKHVKR